MTTLCSVGVAGGGGDVGADMVATVSSDAQSGGASRGGSRLPDLGAPLLRPLVITPHGGFKMPRPQRHGVHEGLDFATDRGDVVLSSTDGTVARIGFDPPINDGGHNGGHFVIVSTAGLEIGYMHLQDIIVRTGDAVRKGQTLATIDNNHLHFQVRDHRMAVDVTRLVPRMSIAAAIAGPPRSLAVTPASPPPATLPKGPIPPGAKRGEVWLLTRDSEVPLYSQLPGGAGFGPSGNGEGFGSQVIYPDGTPARARFWLPKTDLERVGFTPVVRGSFLLGTDPRSDTTRSRHEQGAGGWAKDTGSMTDSPTPTWIYYRDYVCGTQRESADASDDAAGAAVRAASRSRVAIDRRFGNYWIPLSRSSHGTSLVAPEVHFDTSMGSPADLPFEGAGPYLGGWAHRVDGACRRANGAMGASGESRFALNFVASFDWTAQDPAIAAPIWLWLNLGDPANMKFRVREAEVVRADLQAIEAAGEPNELPGRAWLDMNFLEAMATGAHGMRDYAVLRPDGSIDEERLGRFVADSKKNGWGWDTILGWGQRHGAMMAALASDRGDGTLIGPRRIEHPGERAIAVGGTPGPREPDVNEVTRAADDHAGERRAERERVAAERAARRVEAERAAAEMRAAAEADTDRKAKAAHDQRTAEADRIGRSLDDNLRRAQQATRLATEEASAVEDAMRRATLASASADEIAKAFQPLAMPVWKSTHEAASFATRARRATERALDMGKRAADLARESQAAIEGGGPLGPAAMLEQRSAALTKHALEACDEAEPLVAQVVVLAAQTEARAADARRKAAAREAKQAVATAPARRPEHPVVAEAEKPKLVSAPPAPRPAAAPAEKPKAVPSPPSPPKPSPPEPARTAQTEKPKTVARPPAVAKPPVAEAPDPVADDDAAAGAGELRTAEGAQLVATASRDGNAASPHGGTAPPDADVKLSATDMAGMVHQAGTYIRRTRAMLEEIALIRSRRAKHAAEAGHPAKGPPEEEQRLERTRTAVDLAEQAARVATAAVESHGASADAKRLALQAAHAAMEAARHAERAAYFCRKIEQAIGNAEGSKAFVTASKHASIDSQRAEQLARDAASTAHKADKPGA